MKYIFYFLFSIIVSNSLLAQSVARHSALRNNHDRVLHGLLMQNNAQHSGMKGTAGVAMQRVIAQSTRDSNIVPLIDSVNLRYNLFRGSTYDYNTMIYPYNYPYSSTPMFDFAGTFTKPQVLYDTMMHWTVDPNTLVYGYYETNFVTYDGSYNLTALLSTNIDSTINPNMKFANNFTAANKIALGYSSNYIAGAVDSVFKQYFSYNTANKLIADSTYERHLGVWRLAGKDYYTYDGSNNLIQIDNYANMTDTSFLLPLVIQHKYVNTYDGSNRLLTVLDSTFNGTSLMQNEKDTMAYTGALPFHTSWKQYQWDAINSYWAPMFYMSKHLNGLNLPDTVTIQGFDSLLNSWVPQTMNVIHYNASNNPDSLKDFEYRFTYFPTLPRYTTTYYYQTYTNALEAGSQVATVNTVKVYPNPANDMIKVSGLSLVVNTPVTYSVINMSGQLMSRERAPWMGEQQISLERLVPGTYLLVVQDKDGHTLHEQSILKN